MKNFQDLFRHEVQDIYSAETQLEKALAEYEKNAKSESLKEALRLHRGETQRQIKRLEGLANTLKFDISGHTCEAMKIFLKEAQNIMKADYPPEVRDAALISSIQRIKHYEIALYGTLKAFARSLKMGEADRVFNEILKEEMSVDKNLSEIATGKASGHGLNEDAISKKAA